MTALAHQFPYSDHSHGRAPRLELVPPYQAPVRLAPVVFWRRRIVALIVLATLAVGAWSLVTSGAGLISSQTSAPAKEATAGLGGVSPAAQPSLSGTQWTVRPGDTLWSIARAVKPTGDIRTVLDPLMKQYEGQPLQIGQTITLPTFKD